MNSITPISVSRDGDFTSTPSSDGPVLGQWYWVLSAPKGSVTPESGATDSDSLDEEEASEEDEKWLGCAVLVGSNFIELNSPHSKSGYQSIRVHLESFWTRLQHEPNAEAVIRARIHQHQEESIRLMGEVQKLTQRLGLTPVAALPGGPTASQGSPSTALAVLSEQNDVNAYGRSLALAKEKELPELFAAIEREHADLATWMKAQTLPLKASVDAMKGSMDVVDDRIFSISLYAGLTENSIKCCDGKPAELGEKLHVMQRMHYMDEESLLDYRAGGMTFNGIDEFDKWMCQPKNRDRIMPFPRTLVAMRVRRQKKERDCEGSLLRAYVNMKLAQSDMFTFLYIRNGDQVWRLDCEMDFGSVLFPDKSLYDPLEPKMAKMFGGRVDQMMTVSEYEVNLTEHLQQQSLSKAWEQANPKADHWRNPHTRNHWRFRPDEWAPVDHSNVYHDECLADIEKKVKEYNRVALIIQGLFDRSMVLHPHLPVQSWFADGFDRAITLVYDASNVLMNGEAPDFEAYRQECNASLRVGSITTGQEDFWLLKEGSRESERIDNDHRNRSEYRPKRFSPYGNPGPGLIAKVRKWSSKSKTAHFSWERKKHTGDYGDTVNCNLSVPTGDLFNVSAYKPGDYLRFFSDPRTREHYLRWAPLLLAAEDYHAGKSSK